MEFVSSSRDNSDENAVDNLFRRGAFLRKLRELEQADEIERNQCTTNSDDKDLDNGDAGDLTLRYDSFLAHQSYYDDYKHVNYRYVDFGNIAPKKATNDMKSSLIIEQDRTIGKGGFVWDAGFVLGQHVINEICCQEHSLLEDKRVIELGAGTGMTGLMVAKALPNVHLDLSDLPEVVPLLQKNISSNSTPNASAFVLEWGATISNQSMKNNYDVILGADVVASIYNSSALVKTISQLAHERTWVFITLNKRLTSIVEQFERDMRQSFGHVEIRKPVSDNKNPNVWVMVARKKHSIQ